MSWDGTVRCGNCYGKGHNRSGCPELITAMKRRLEEDPEDWRAVRFFAKKSKRGKNKKCSYCAYPGHTRRTCKELKYAKVKAASLCREWRKKLVEVLKTTGIGIGSLIEYHIWGDKKLGIVSSILWDRLDHRIAIGYGGDPCALLIKPVGEIIQGSTRRIQVPAHEGLFSKDNLRYYKEKSPSVVGPLSAEIVERQVPAGFLTGDSCIEPIFKEDAKSQDRTASRGVSDWCEIQGFYTLETSGSED